ncbi:MAG: FG-GAP repeat protein, partial [bacterium]
AAWSAAPSGTTRTQQPQLTASDGAANDEFGRSVGLSGDFTIIGAFTDDVGANGDQGTSLVFSGVGSVWIGPDLTLLASDGAALDNFGHAVAIDGDTAIVSAPLDDVGANVDQGSAYIF